MMERKRLKVLIIDDDEPTNFLNKVIIKKADIASEIIPIDKASLAAKYLEEIERDKVPDLILLDINMPAMNGWEFIEEYAKLPGYILDKAKLFILTTSLNPYDEERSKQYKQVQGYLIKPLTKDILLEVYQNHF